ncbi:hypothetical protein Lepto7375DRAFT_5498 [Leptolyngbya sp. PCC 7375]|nr:hypothetical protein Lepto7375DRAFT_5498 [Leptolyngbya sp. PCC 7375]
MDTDNREKQVRWTLNPLLNNISNKKLGPNWKQLVLPTAHKD